MGKTHLKRGKNGSESANGETSEQSDGSNSSAKGKLENICKEEDGRGKAPD